MKTSRAAKPDAAKRLQSIYQKLYKHFGPQSWWPGDTKLEVIVGAVLTQNTNWKNVEKAIHNLKKADVLSLGKIDKISVKRLAVYIKPSGYFNLKAKRLKSVIRFIVDQYGRIAAMERQPTDRLRAELLGVYGVGPETADSILLYALDRPVFVIDTYTKRILSRYGLVKKDADYAQLQAFFMKALKRDASFFNEYHALLVCLGKDFCRPKPLCERCPIKSDCQRKI